MKKQTVFALVIFVLALSSCGTTPPAAPTTPTLLPTQQTVIPTNIIYPTLTSTPLTTAISYPTVTPLPTEIPYPTASVVNANAVAFIAEGALWVANVDGSGERKLVDMIHNKNWVYDKMLQWSPDGKWIGYFSKDEVWIISPDGLTNKKVLSFPNLYTYVWSPDGSKIAFNRLQEGKPLTIGILDIGTEKTLEVSTHIGPDPMPLSWSSDGRYLLFTKADAFVLFDVNTYKVAKEIKPSGSCWLGWNSWSPNGKWFSHEYHGNGYYASNWTCISSLDSGLTWEIENASDTSSGEVWDKTGNYLYFVVAKFDPTVEQQLIRYDVRTRKQEKLLSLEGSQRRYMWSVSISPNGNTMALRSCATDLSQCSFIVMDTQSLSVINKYIVGFGASSKIEMYYPYPVWSADNQHLILFVRALHGGSFHALEIRTGKTTSISGNHSVANGIISPVATTP